MSRPSAASSDHAGRETHQVDGGQGTLHVIHAMQRRRRGRAPWVLVRVVQEARERALVVPAGGGKSESARVRLRAEGRGRRATLGRARDVLARARPLGRSRERRARSEARTGSVRASRARRPSAAIPRAKTSRARAGRKTATRRVDRESRVAHLHDGEDDSPEASAFAPSIFLAPNIVPVLVASSSPRPQRARTSRMRPSLSPVSVARVLSVRSTTAAETSA